MVHFDEIEYYLSKELISAKSRLLIAVSWFTNVNLAQIIFELKKRHVDIEIIIDDNEINRKSNALRIISQNGIDLTFIKNLTSSRNLMHNKFCVIDNLTVITGSYNWTANANYNDENIFITNDKNTASFYSHEFRRIRMTGQPKDKINFDQNESNDIVDSLLVEFKRLLKNAVDNEELTIGLLANYENEGIKNKIRTLSEETTNNLKGKVGTFGIYFDLIKEYGSEFNSKATEEEKASSRLKFRKQGLEDNEITVDHIFKKFKLRATQKLAMKYTDLIKRDMSDNQIDRVIRVFQFIVSEKCKLGTELGIAVG